MKKLIPFLVICIAPFISIEKSEALTSATCSWSGRIGYAWYNRPPNVALPGGEIDEAIRIAAFYAYLPLTRYNIANFCSYRTFN
ncbi:hypothetical protein [Nostoc sp. WHI]|uniref:hypothetical protein n=1 Tax=Nostoc sp. WHI TaxID=2650611 RepID=UPI0018C5CC00|nr:hypothetical protein [Nostoc sp. WHI]MBG1268706.1 hypothetical protein [Nostoc sp. WHI]